jgi:predicted MPP superfamily phosphohydrolase
MYFYYTIAALLGGNAFGWFLVVNYFNVQSTWQKILLAIIILFLGASSMISFLWIYKRDTPLVRLYYFISASWMGILLNFILVTAGASLLFLVSLGLGLNLDWQTINIVMIIGTLWLTGFSYYNAFIIRVEKHVVKIKNLPPAWEGKKIVHISDIHLGPILRQKFFNKVISRVKSLQPAAVFITGDLFDGSESDFSWVTSPLDNLNAPLGLYYSFGNHDFTLGHDRVTDLLQGQNITILDNLLIKKEGLQVIGLNFTPDRDFDLKRAVLAYNDYQPTEPSIVMFHEPKDTAKLRGIGVDLLLSGHTHGGQMFPFNYLASYFYHQHSHGVYRSFDFTMCVTSGVGTWGPPMRTGTQSEIIELTLQKK